MTYDAVLAARRGLGVDEERLADMAFAEAVRWAAFVDAEAPRLALLRDVAATDPPDDLEGAALTRFRANRDRARTELAELEPLLYPDDEGA